MRYRLSDELVKKMPPGAVWRDETLQGFCARRPRKSTVVTFEIRRDGRAFRRLDPDRKPFFAVVGHHPPLKTADARSKAAKILAEVELGQHAPRAQTNAITFAAAWRGCRDLLEAKIKIAERSPKTLAAYDSSFRRLEAKLGAVPMTELTPQLAADAFKTITGLSAAHATERFLMVVWYHAAELHKNLALDRLTVPNFLLATTSKTVKPRCFMKAAQFADWWLACKALPNPIRTELHLVTLCTGLRDESVRTLRKEDIAADGCSIFVHTAKGRKEFDCLLNAPARASIARAIEATKTYFSGSPYIFGGSAGYAADTHQDKGAIGYTGHDLRRSMATLASEKLGIPEDIISRLLAHAPGSVTGGYIQTASFEAAEKIGAAIVAALAPDDPEEQRRLMG